MKIVIGNKLMGPAPEELPVNRVSFIAEDGRAMFEVCILNETTIEVRGVNVCKVADKMYQETLMIQPRAANQVWISTKEYNH
jgi:hypothetical protein